MADQERDAEMLGVPVCRYGYDDYDSGIYTDPDAQNGRWHAEPVAVARQRVVEAARLELSIALAGLDAAEGGAGT